MDTNGTDISQQKKDIIMQLFESENMSLSFKQAIDPNHFKYIIGSLAGRSESMIKDGVRKLPSPLTVNLAQHLVDEEINVKKQSLYLQFYLNCGSEVFCLLKHKQIKIKSGEYSYRIEEQLGKIERNEKKPTKPSFKLGVMVTRKYLVLDTINFTRKFNKYRNREEHSNGNSSIVCWVESNSFQSATRDEICKQKGGVKHSYSSSEDLFEQIKEIKLDFEQTVEKQVRLKKEIEEKLALLMELTSGMDSSTSQTTSSPVKEDDESNTNIDCCDNVHNGTNSPFTNGSNNGITFSLDEVFGFTVDVQTLQALRLVEQQQQQESNEQTPTVITDIPFVFSNQI